jgi:hypothetical protein
MVIPFLDRRPVEREGRELSFGYGTTTIKPDEGRVMEALRGMGEDIIGYTKRYIKV